MAFGVEARTQKVLDRLRKSQTLARLEEAVSKAKRHGDQAGSLVSRRRLARRNDRGYSGQFPLCCPTQTGTFRFDRLCAYRGTLLWQEYTIKERHPRGEILGARGTAAAWFIQDNGDGTYTSMGAPRRPSLPLDQ